MRDELQVEKKSRLDFSELKKYIASPEGRAQIRANAQKAREFLERHRAMCIQNEKLLRNRPVMR